MSQIDIWTKFVTEIFAVLVPEVIIEGSWVFEPEDVEVLWQGDRVKQEQQLKKNGAPKSKKANIFTSTFQIWILKSLTKGKIIFGIVTQ